LAALRVRNRIFDVLRLGTPMSGGYESTISLKNNRPPEEGDSLKLVTLVKRRAPILTL